MARRKITPQFRARFSEKLMELGNLIAIALVFGQFISGRGFDWQVFLAGLILAFLCYIASYMISR